MLGQAVAQATPRLLRSRRHALERLLSALQLGVREQAHELVAAIPEHDVLSPQALQHHVGHAFEKRVAGCVAPAVVDPFEPVDVHEGDHQRSPVPAGARQLPLQGRDAGGTPGDAGQLVDRDLIAHSGQ